MRPILFVLCAVSLMGASPAQADLYKWTDSQGQVHYTDQPPAKEQSQRIGRSTDPEREQEARSARQELADKVSQSQRQRQLEQEARAKRQAELDKEQQKADNCSKARERLSLLQQNNRISRLNDQGQRYILDEAQRQAAITEARQQADKLCK